MRPFRGYIDTSVVGGCLDEEFADDSLRVINAARTGRLVLLVSDILDAELSGAPPAVQTILQGLPPSTVEDVPVTRDVLALRDAYLDAGIVDRRSINDAGHVAAATIARADAIVSWNFRHIVRLDKIRAYNQVNLMNGYGILTILSPN